MQFTPESIRTLVEKVSSRAQKVELGSRDELTGAKLAKEVVEEMGFNYEKSLVYYNLNNAKMYSSRLEEFFTIPAYQPKKAKEQGLLSDRTAEFYALGGHDSSMLKMALGGQKEDSHLDVAAVLFCCEKFKTNKLREDQLGAGLLELRTKGLLSVRVEKELKGFEPRLENYKDDPKEQERVWKSFAAGQVSGLCKEVFERDENPPFEEKILYKVDVDALKKTEQKLKEASSKTEEKAKKLKQMLDEMVRWTEE
jgi:hypothetical protein